MLSGRKPRSWTRTSLGKRRSCLAVGSGPKAAERSPAIWRTDLLRQAYRGRSVSPLGRGALDTEAWRVRFESCRIDEAEPFACVPVAKDSPTGKYLFVAEHELQELVAAVGGSLRNPLPGYMSPYLKALLVVCDDLKITPSNQPTPAQIGAALDRVWEQQGRDLGELKPFLKQKMATILREPKSPNRQSQNKFQASLTRGVGPKNP